MALRNLRYLGDEILTKKCRPVKDINNNILTLLDDMVDTMHDHNGVGLAASQVGVLKRVVVINIEDNLIELINPEIIETSGMEEKTEACLSIPGKCAIVKRPTYVKVKALNRDGEEFIIDGEGMLAVAFCHELDHLDGITYNDIAIEGTFRDNLPEDYDELEEA